ncbi:hypothetical protein Tco_0361155 [Tanacetum coccineum]
MGVDENEAADVNVEDAIVRDDNEIVEHDVNESAQKDKKEDEVARLKRNYEEFWESQYTAGYKKPRRTS